jgi:hypothetical protein
MRARYSLSTALIVLSLAVPRVARAQGDPTPQDKEEERVQEALEERLDQSIWRGIGIRVARVPHTEMIAVLHDVDIEDDFLMVRFRFFNDGTENARLVIDPSHAYESYFVEVQDEKRFIRRDQSGRLDAKTQTTFDIRPGEMASWWARFPPLPLDTRSFHVVVPPVPPLLDVSVDAD